MATGHTRLAAAACLAAGLAGCEDPAFTEPVVLGGQEVSAAVLSRGRDGYVRNCYACHGMKGDGKGPSAPGLRPPPRDFTQGAFKFAAVAGGELPNDEDFVRVVKKGLHGTAMLAWDVPDKELGAIVQYLKTFSERWRDPEARPGEPIVPGPDPYGQARAAEAVERGERLYHVTARCSSCHANYLTRAEFAAVTQELLDYEVTEFREDFNESVLKESDYGVKILPPDFLISEVRSGSELADVYRVIASGVGGTAMPTWKGALPEEDLWALTYYTRSIIALKGTPQGRALKSRLREQPPPPPPAP